MCYLQTATSTLYIKMGQETFLSKARRAFGSELALFTLKLAFAFRLCLSHNFLFFKFSPYGPMQVGMLSVCLSRGYTPQFSKYRLQTLELDRPRDW